MIKIQTKNQNLNYFIEKVETKSNVIHDFLIHWRNNIKNAKDTVVSQQQIQLTHSIIKLTVSSQHIQLFFSVFKKQAETINLEQKNGTKNQANINILTYLQNFSYKSLQESQNKKIKKQMSKKSFVSMKCDKKVYRIYLNDVMRVHSIIKKSTPPVPAYIQLLSPKSIEKQTTMEFDSYSML